MRAVFLDFGTVSSGDLDTGPLQRAAPGIVLHEQTPAADVPARIAGFEAVFANKSVISRAMIEANPQLRFIALTATGTDNVDLAAAREAQVAVCNLRDYCTPSVVQHVFAMLLALTHRLRDYDALVHSGRWEQAGQFSVFPYPIRELRGRVFGIVGHGALGRAVARVAASFGMVKLSGVLRYGGVVKDLDASPDAVITSLTVQPLSGLEYGATYQLDLTDGIQDLDATPQGLVPYTRRFTTFTPPTPQRPGSTARAPPLSTSRCPAAPPAAHPSGSTAARRPRRALRRSST